MGRKAVSEKGLPENLYCPQCGLRLEKSTKWKPENESANYEYRICQGKHLWEITKGIIGGITFRTMKFVVCECGEDIPDHFTHQFDKRKLCSDCYKKASEAWRMDSEESFARMDITPVQTPEGMYYQVHSSIEIKPYPNPIGYGGSWGSGSAKDAEELSADIEQFIKLTDSLKKQGMAKIEVITHDLETRTTQPKLIQPEAKKVKSTQQLATQPKLVEEAVKEPAKPVEQQLSLI